MFEPNFDIYFNCNEPLETVVNAFQLEFNEHIVETYGWRCETNFAYISFHNQEVHYHQDVVGFPYTIRVIGKSALDSPSAQTDYVTFAKQILAFVSDYDEAVDIAAYFSLD